MDLMQKVVGLSGWFVAKPTLSSRLIRAAITSRGFASFSLDQTIQAAWKMSSHKKRQVSLADLPSLHPIKDYSSS
ncbi:hypothetical protein [Noviherbaspirillum humi]|uniref:hypothetical protein n=1 Tax=Noviherbaspirillum humi TaxID=1688639 RepID=UPI0011602FE5|nr:hypothetical protein [Noviherbaspirillum humi]